MNVGLVILCRLSSSRLPGKILMEIDGLPILQHIINRLQLVKPLKNIVVATSNHESDDLLKAYCLKNGVNCFRGDLNNVAERFLGAAKQFNFDYATRINGDNLFIDVDALEEMIEISEDGNYDFISNVKDRTFPFGMSIEIVKTSFYKQLLEKLTDKDYQEHVTLYLYHHPDFGKQYHFENKECPEAKGLHFAIDQVKDYEKAKAIMEILKTRNYEYNLEELVEIEKEIKV